MIGVISDTHGLLRPEALAALQGSELILHAGDIGPSEILETLRDIAPVRVVRGNCDQGPWARALPETEVVTVGGRDIYMIHDIGQLDLSPATAGFLAVVYGHSHQPKIEERDGVLYLNPGSAGRRRFTLPVSVALLHLGARRATAEIIELDV
ncbi:MAG: metallophosphoesterase family protein [Acidobacteriota bacterium]|jgi:putative phosphoesterase